jgi:hypothetical protein
MAALSFQRKVLILGVCIAVLSATYILGLVFSPARVGRREAEAPLIPGFDRGPRERVAEMRITSEEGSLSVVKRGDSWILPGGDRDYPASASRVDAFLGFLADLKRSRVVTDNPDAWEEFEVHTESPRHIQLLDSSGSGLIEIIVGKAAAGGGSDYVRLANANEVVLSNRSFDYYLSVDDKFWAYLRIFPEDLEGQEIMRITVNSTLQFDGESPDSGTTAPLEYTLVLSTEQPNLWKLVDGPQGDLDGDLDNKEVDRLATNLADLEGTEFARGVSLAEAGLSDPSARVLISTEDDTDFRLLIGREAGDDQYYVTLENGSFIYKVSEWRVKGILKDVQDLRAASEQETEQQ